MLATASTGRFRRARRVSSSPTGMPTETASAVETATSQRCSPVSDRTSRQLRATNSKKLTPGPPGSQKVKGKLPSAEGKRQKLKGKREDALRAQSYYLFFAACLPLLPFAFLLLPSLSAFCLHCIVSR